MKDWKPTRIQSGGIPQQGITNTLIAEIEILKEDIKTNEICLKDDEDQIKILREENKELIECINFIYHSDHARFWMKYKINEKFPNLLKSIIKQ